MKSKNNIILAPTNYQGENWAHHGMVMMNHENRGSTRYMFSVGEKDNPLLLGLKRKCAAHNKYIRSRAYKYGWDMNDSWITLMRVSCMARGPRAIHAKAMGYHPRAYDQSLPHKFAKYFDVYYHKDTHANWIFNCNKEERIEKERMKAEYTEILLKEEVLKNKKAHILSKIKGER